MAVYDGGCWGAFLGVKVEVRLCSCAVVVAVAGVRVVRGARARVWVRAASSPGSQVQRLSERGSRGHFTAFCSMLDFPASRGASSAMPSGSEIALQQRHGGRWELGDDSLLHACSCAAQAHTLIR
eukprot:scaffold20104_cov120-Isochrysis_galbana.AAC.3